MTTRHGGRFLRSTCRRAPRSSAAEIDPNLPFAAEPPLLRMASLHLNVRCFDDGRPTGNFVFHHGREWLLAALSFIGSSRFLVGKFEHFS
jgi:hypothetical protein